MKSKITNKPKILMKGIVFFLILIIMLSYTSGFNIVLGEETTEVVDRNEDLFSEVDVTLISLTKDIENMLRQIEELNSTFKCEDFFAIINNNSTIYISNEIELRALSIYVAEGYDCTGKTFILTKSIALTDALEWNPIGDTNTPFKGTIDGAGFTISGIKISQKQSYAGFIGCIENGTIKNLNISNSSINIPAEVDNVNSNDLTSSTSVSYSYLGAIVGYAQNSTIINCKNSTNVLGGNNVGGIVGFCNDTIIDNCSNKGYVNGLMPVGGIVGRFERSTKNNVCITRCKNSGRVHSIIGNAGGIAGYVYGAVSIVDSINSGVIAISEEMVKTPYNANINLEEIPENAGGIVGWISGKTSSDVSIIKNCINTENAQVVGYKDIGGIAGQLGGNTTGKAVAQNCINYSKNIYSTDINEENTPLETNKAFSAGQIAGSVGLATGKIFSTNTAEEQKAIGIISKCYYIVDNGTDKNVSNKSTKDTVMAYGHSEYVVNTNTLIIDQYDNEEGGFSTPNTEEYPEPAILKIEDNESSYKYQLEEEGDYLVITDEVLEENEYLDFVYDQTDTMFYIDNVKPEIQSVEITNSGAPSIAIAGDTLTIRISFDEEINLNRIQPIVRLFNNKYATYTGISSDGKTLTFKYTLDGSESGAIENTVYLTAIIADAFENLNNVSTQLTIDEGNDIIAITGDTSTTCILTNEEYNIAYKIESPKLINGKLYFSKNDTVKITAILGGKLTSNMTESIVPSLTVKINGVNNTIETTLDKIDENNGTIEYEFSSEGYNGQITKVYLNSTSNDVIYGEGYTNRLGEDTVVDFTDYNIFIDSVAPTLKLSANPTVSNESGRYGEGEEIIIKATTSEEIDLEESIRPEFIVSFSESGFGKYNNKNENTANAIYVETVKNTDENNKVTYTYKYKYVIQNGDEGTMQYNFADENGKIVDIAGNEIVLTKYPESPSTRINTEDLKDIKLSDDVTTITYKIYKNNVEITDFSNNTYYEKDDKIKVEAIFSNPLYKSYGSSEELVDSETAPKLIINEINSELTGVVSNDGKKVTYEYQITNESNQKLTQLKLQTSNRIFPLTEDGYNTINAGTINTINIEDANLYIYNGVATFEGNNLYADTIAPTVEIIARDVNDSITNKDVITYEFKWSEEVVGFIEDNITVNGGSKGTLSDVTINTDGTYSYTMDIETNTQNGNTGNIQAIVEQDEVQDKVGLGNVRCENIIRVDKQSPILIGLEAYAKSETVDIISNEVSQVKENYKSGDTVTIVATFSENIEDLEIPALALQFSESGYANGVVNPGVKDGNKITYTYTIDSEDKGILSVAEFTGKVKDTAGNETVVTKRALDGNTVIADSEAPKLVGITAIAPEFEYNDLLSNDGETRRYGIGSQIKLIAEFDENVYSYDSNDRVISNITSETAPELNFKFGDTSRKATFSKVDGKTIEYIYTIDDEDNGQLSFVNISGTGAKAIYDIAGNSVTELTADLEEYLGQTRLEDEEHISADTTAPTVTLQVTNVENTEITSTNNNYKAGTKLTITATTNEYIYDKNGNNLSKLETDVRNAFSIKFGEITANGITCKDVTYENNKTVFTYEYTIKDGDMGPIQLSFASDSYSDIAINKNEAGETHRDSIVVKADTENPYYYDQPGIEYTNGKYTVTFNEDLYYLDEDNVVRAFGNIDYAPTLKFENEITEYTARVSRNVLNYTGAYVNAKPYLSASRLCDAAGNLYSYFDQVAPVLSKIEVISPETGTYKAGEEITIVATFDEDITATTLPTLSLQFSESEDAKGDITGSIAGNTITYVYTIAEQDNGLLSIKEFTGTVKDASNNETVLSKKDLDGSRITADTEAPTLVITSDAETTNLDKVTYTLTWSEQVKDFDIDDIEVINGAKGVLSDPLPNNDGTVSYTLEVYTANAGRQLVRVDKNICTDMVGNLNSEAVIKSVVVDFTQIGLRATVNGGKYVIDKDNNNSTLKEKVVITGSISKLEYKWSTDGENIPTQWQTYPDIDTTKINSDATFSTSVDAEGTYYLYVRVTDKNNKVYTGRTNGFVVENQDIVLTPNITNTTKQDVRVTVTYGDALTENRKAGIQGKTQSDSLNTVIVSENGVVYAEATDKAGNRVYKVLEISNIDKTGPVIISITKDPETTATSVVLTVNVEDPEEEIDGYSIDNGTTWQDSNEFTVTSNGTYTILVKDNIGNISQKSIIVNNIGQTEDTYFRITNYAQKTEANVKYVIGISAYTKVSDFIPYIQTNLGYTIKDKNENVISGNDLIGTNTKISVSNGDEYILVVKGDLNGDGKIGPSDIGNLANYYIGNITLPKAYQLAGDYIFNGIVDLTDISELAKDIAKMI